MADDGLVTARTRKLYYDDYTGGFYFESKVESLERTCRQRQEKIETINKGAELQMASKHKQVENARALFTGKLSREVTALRKSLQDMVAYRRVLAEIARMKNDSDGHDSCYGKYGLMPELEDIHPMMDGEKIRMDPAYRRRKEAASLLARRRSMHVLDRNAATPELLKSWRRSSASAPSEANDDRAEVVAKLMLPPITALPLHRRVRNEVIQSRCEGRKSNMEPLAETTSEAAATMQDANLPSIFVTQDRKPKTPIAT